MDAIYCESVSQNMKKVTKQRNKHDIFVSCRVEQKVSGIYLGLG